MTITNANLKAYDILSRFYRQLVLPRDHFGRQLQLIDAIVEKERLDRSGRFLDAACGTGDVVCGLVSRGYGRIDALDGSRAMVEVAQAEGRCIHAECVDWRELPTYFARRDPYDLIFVLGNAIAHLAREHLPRTLQAFHSALRTGGILLFDLRPWERDSDGHLRQVDRAPNVCRLLGRIWLEESEYWLDEIVSYDDERQLVTYQLRPVAGDSVGPDVKITVSYSLFDHEEAKELLAAIGFQAHNIETRRFESWPYLVVVARK